MLDARERKGVEGWAGPTYLKQHGAAMTATGGSLYLHCGLNHQALHQAKHDKFIALWHRQPECRGQLVAR